MYFEEAVVKEYPRKDGKPNKQLNLGVNSKYKKKDKVIILSSENIQTFKEKLEPKTKELEATVKRLENENQKLKLDLEKLKEEKTNFESEKNELITTTNAYLLEAKDTILKKEEEISRIKTKHAKEIKEKDSEIKELNINLNNEKDTSKTLLLAIYSYEERGYINGFLNRTPQLAKQILKENPKPIETNKKE